MRPSPTPPHSRIIFDSAIGIGFARQISDIPVVNGMRKKIKTPSAASTESAVRDGEERLRAILETAVEGIITIDERGTIESFNPASEKIFGYAAAEVIGKNVKVLMATPHREQHDGYLKNYRDTGHAKIIGIGRETFARKKDGTLFPMDLSVSEVKLSDRRIFTGFVRDITERKRMEKEILEISEREQRRIGHDLHDSLGQHLTATALAGKVLAKKLTDKSLPEAAAADRVVALVEESIELTRKFARNLHPIELQANGLADALQNLAANISGAFNVGCRFEHSGSVVLAGHDAEIHLYRIAQEAASNAIRHGRARNVIVSLDAVGEKTMLTVTDDGAGLAADARTKKGMGLRIMEYRAGMVGATFDIQNLPAGGTRAVCVLNPGRPPAEKDDDEN